MKPYLQLPDVSVYHIQDVSKIPRMVRLTKWLKPVRSEFEYLANEQRRISKDSLRTCYIVYSQNEISLYVNDLTGGAFDKLGEEE